MFMTPTRHTVLRLTPHHAKSTVDDEDVDVVDTYGRCDRGRGSEVRWR